MAKRKYSVNLTKSTVSKKAKKRKVRKRKPPAPKGGRR
jgi:hypothetical protein